MLIAVNVVPVNSFLYVFLKIDLCSYWKISESRLNDIRWKLPISFQRRLFLILTFTAVSYKSYFLIIFRKIPPLNSYNPTHNTQTRMNDRIFDLQHNRDSLPSSKLRTKKSLQSANPSPNVYFSRIDEKFMSRDLSSYSCPFNIFFFLSHFAPNYEGEPQDFYSLRTDASCTKKFMERIGLCSKMVISTFHLFSLTRLNLYFQILFSYFENTISLTSAFDSFSFPETNKLTSCRIVSVYLIMQISHMI